MLVNKESVTRPSSETSSVSVVVAVSSVTADPDARFVRGLWLVWVLVAPLGIALLVYAPTVFMPLFAPLLALLLLWPLWRGGRALWRAIVDAPHQEWNGSYFEFDGRQIRIQVDGEHALWICAADVFDALAIEDRGRNPERVRLDAGRDGLQQLPGERLLWFSEPGLLAWLTQRRAERCVIFARWLDAEVVGPQRKRRQRLGIDEPRPGDSSAM